MSAITTDTSVWESEVAKTFVSAQYLAIAGTVSTAAAAAICYSLHEGLLALALVLTCGQQVGLQMKLQRLQRTTMAALTTGRVPRQRDTSS